MSIFDDRWRARKVAEIRKHLEDEARQVQGETWLTELQPLLSSSRELRTGRIIIEASQVITPLTLIHRKGNDKTIIAQYRSDGPTVEFERPGYRPAGGIMPSEFRPCTLQTREDLHSHVDALLYRFVGPVMDVASSEEADR